MPAMKGSPSQLRRQRLNRGWSQAELAERAKTRQHEISKYELGKQMPTWVTLDRLAAAFEVDSLEVFTWFMPKGR